MLVQYNNQLLSYRYEHTQASFMDKILKRLSLAFLRRLKSKFIE